jgi:hypothetical protein
MILGVAKITLKALIQILKFCNTKPTDATNIFGTRSTHAVDSIHTNQLPLTIASRIPCSSQLVIS